MTEARQKRYRAGIWAEKFAAVWLFFKGYSVLARRYKCPLGEIDLIVKRGKTIAFVEVKYRQSLADAAFSISDHQKQRIVRSANFWLQANSQQVYETLTMDVILLAPLRLPQHIQNAFEA